MWNWIKKHIDINMAYILLGLFVGGISGITLVKTDVQRHDVTLYGTDEHPENGLASRVLVQEGVLKNINTNMDRIDRNVSEMNAKLDAVLIRRNVDYTEK